MEVRIQRFRISEGARSAPLSADKIDMQCLLAGLTALALTVRFVAGYALP